MLLKLVETVIRCQTVADEKTVETVNEISERMPLTGLFKMAGNLEEIVFGLTFFVPYEICAQSIAKESGHPSE